ncbi:MAG: pyridoxal phosphate-dependent aminotransferase [Bacteroidales bacterium]|nr:pyridoxal phosphate-dependent aminotransferase [Bacteroidales bacterium]
MSEKISTRINSLAVSQTLAMAQKSRELQSQGIDVINLSVGEPDFPTPDHIKEAAKKAIDENFSYYTPVPGIPELRKAIVEKFKRENNLDYTVDQIIVSAGAKHSIANVLACVVDVGDEVIIPAPYWVSYVEMVKLADGVNVIVPAGIENDFKITPEQLEAAITPKTRAFLFSSPSNPTGSLYTKDELKALADVFAKHDNIIIISDEIYEHINYVGKHESIAQFENVKNRTVVVNGVSKGYAMTGWRIGYIGAPLWIAKACNKLQGQVTSGVCSIAQKAATAALTHDLSTTYKMREAFKRRRDLVLEKTKDIKGMKTSVPGGAFYIFADVTYYFGKSYKDTLIKNPEDLSLYLLAEAHVATVSGDAFGDPNCLRFSYATADDLLIKAMDRIKNALDKLS